MRTIFFAGAVAVFALLPTAAHAADTSKNADTYKNYAELAAHETEGTDYRRVVRDARGGLAHIAIHGGSIEPGSSQLADYAARKSHGSYYAFEGIKASGNGVLHITADHFDEPRGLRVVARSDRTVSWHGYKDDDSASTYVGGRDKALARRVTAALRAAGFRVARRVPSNLAGVSPDNIANRNRSGRGVQLEISSAQRKRFFKGGNLGRAWIEDPAHRTKAFYAYVAAVNGVL